MADQLVESPRPGFRKKAVGDEHLAIGGERKDSQIEVVDQLAVAMLRSRNGFVPAWSSWSAEEAESSFLFHFRHSGNFAAPVSSGRGLLERAHQNSTEGLNLQGKEKERRCQMLNSRKRGDKSRCLNQNGLKGSMRKKAEDSTGGLAAIQQSPPAIREWMVLSLRLPRRHPCAGNRAQRPLRE